MTEHEPDRLQAAARGRPQGPPARHHPRPASCSAGSRRSTAATACGRTMELAGVERLVGAPRGKARPHPAAQDRPSHSDVSAVPGRRRQHGPPVRGRSGRARARRRGLHRSVEGGPPDPGRWTSTGCHPFRDRQRASHPEAGHAQRLRRRPPPLPVHLRLGADSSRSPERSGEGRRSSSTTRTASSATGGAGRSSRPTSTPSRRALIRAADRVCVLSPDHADSVSYLRRAGAEDPAKLIEMPNGVDAERFSPGDDRPAFASASAFPRTRW